MIEPGGIYGLIIDYKFHYIAMLLRYICPTYTSGK